METKLAERKWDERWDFDGILAINQRHSSPRHLIFRGSLDNLLLLMNLGVITLVSKGLRLFHCFGYLCIDLYGFV